MRQLANEGENATKKWKVIILKRKNKSELNISENTEEISGHGDVDATTILKTLRI